MSKSSWGVLVTVFLNVFLAVIPERWRPPVVVFAAALLLALSVLGAVFAHVPFLRKLRESPKGIHPMTLIFVGIVGFIVAIVLWQLIVGKTEKSVAETPRSTSPEFRQRQDRFAQKISELNDRYNELRLISARLDEVAVKNAGLALRGEAADRNTALIAAIKEKREGIDKEIKLWAENIEMLHSKYRNLTLETDAPEIERLIAIVQVASDDLKKNLSIYSSMLHTLETTNEFMKTTLAETAEKIRQINAEFDRNVEKLNLDYERKVEKINQEFERKKEKLENTKQPSPTPDKGASPP